MIRLMRLRQMDRMVVARMASSRPEKTCLFDFHEKHGGKMVDFAGWHMPVLYSDLSIADSTIHTRKNVSLFDVSHMLQTKVFGKNRIEFIESLTTADIQALRPDSGTLTVFTNGNGGIEDDLIVTKTSGSHLYVVTNAGCIPNDMKILKEGADRFRQSGKDVTIEHLHGRGLLALQGPLTQQVLQAGVSDDLSKLMFMCSVQTSVFGIPDCRVTRCGYTGEDGVEISVDKSRTAELAERLITQDNVKLAGLGARDALRLEAGLCLYGNDINRSTTPVEATLMWLIAKRRRQEANFPGAKQILAQISDKNLVKRKRVGFIGDGKPVREHIKVIDANDNEVGEVTSGCPSPCLKRNIGMAYVPPSMSAVGTELRVVFKGGKTQNVVVSKMPFIASRYHTVK